jgi:hypothetical protein
MKLCVHVHTPTQRATPVLGGSKRTAPSLSHHALFSSVHVLQNIGVASDWRVATGEKPKA